MKTKTKLHNFIFVALFVGFYPIIFYRFFSHIEECKCCCQFEMTLSNEFFCLILYKNPSGMDGSCQSKSKETFFIIQKFTFYIKTG